MADARHRQDYPHQGRPGTSDTQRNYDDQRSGMATSVTLPPIQPESRSPYSAGGSAPPALHQASRGYPHDPHYPSPSRASNGYPHHQAAQPHAPPPPPGPSHGQNYPPSPAYAPHPDHRGSYYDQRQHSYRDAYQQQDPYYYQRQPAGHPMPNGYPTDYRGPAPPPPGYVDFGPPGPGGMGQAAPRQRTSIACKYCRKRKIRCSGYQSAPGGKCQNCARMNQECVFQPVSASSSTAFIPVSAVPGGVPPGTQLFGAYGEPLPHAAYGQHPPPPGQHAAHAMPPHSGHPHSLPPGTPSAPYPPQYPPAPQHGGHPQAALGHYYQHPAQSPTESYSSHGDPRSEENGSGQLAGRRRRRTSEEQEEGYRLPPPRAGGTGDDIHRRSPAEHSNHSSPAGLAHPSRNSFHQPSVMSVGASSGSSTPGRGAPQSAGQPPTSVMSLSNLVTKTDVDKGMINRLDRSRDR